MATLTVGELAVRLEAQTREFKSELKRAARSVSGFEKTTKKNLAGAGKSFTGLLGPIGSVASALVALGAITFGFKIAAGAIQAAASFEAYEVRLKALLGSQEGANKALEAFIEISSKTPFAVSQIVEGATTLASVADESGSKLLALTQVSANLAAVTGLSFTQTAGNLQRALASGIGAADLFRERGVKRLIESITGIPDLTKVPLEELQGLFEEVFGTGAVFGTAAEDLSRTLGGALSNIGDAADNARRALGQALAPTVFSIAKEIAIPFFQELEGTIKDNETAIQEFATRGIQAVLRGLADFIDAGANTLDLLTTMKKQLEAAADGLEVFAVTAAVGFAILNPILAATLIATAAAAKVVSNIDVDDGTDAITEFGEESETAADRLRGLAGGIRVTADRVGELTDEFAKNRAARRGATDEAAAEAKRANRLRLEGIRIANETAAEFEAGDDVEFLEKQERALQDEAEKARVAAETAAEKIAADAERALEKSEREEERTARKSKRAAEKAGEEFRDAVSDGIQFGFDASEAAAEDFGEFLAETAGALLTDALLDALQQSATEGSGIFGDLFKSGAEGGFFDFGSEQFGKALGTGVGILGSLAQNAFGSDSDISNDFVRSAVTSTEAVRGIVAGPSNIPIAEVGESIERSQVAVVAQQRETNEILREIATLLAIAPVGQAASVTSFDAMIAAETINTPAQG